MIAIDDRISDVLARDERLVDVFTEFSPHFAKLRNPKLRRMMGRLVTVRQAARIAGVDPEALLGALNGKAAPADDVASASPFLSRGRGPDGYPPAVENGVPKTRPAGVATTVPAGMRGVDGSAGVATEAGSTPEFLSRLETSSIVDLDVREDLRAGREPFGRIMSAVGTMGDGDVLRLRAIFEPVPLYGVLEKRGLAHWTECLARDDWRVWFFPHAFSAHGTVSRAAPDRATGSEAGPDATAAATYSFDKDEPPVVLRLDVRGLEPPEPMVQTLAALENLPPNGVLVQTNVRVPRFLIEELERRDFRHEVRVLSNDEVEVTIRRAS